MISTLQTNTTNGTAKNQHVGVTATLLLLVSSSIVAAPFQSALAQNVTFGPWKQIVGTPEEDAEPPQIVSSGKNVYIVWHEFPLPNTMQDQQQDVFFSRSADSGGIFSGRINLSNSPNLDSTQEFIAASGKNVFVVWTETDAISQQSEIWFSKSTNSGVNFGPAMRISTTGNPNTPRVATFDKNVFAVWQAEGLGGPPPPPDIFFKQSSDTGNNFSTRKNISNNAGDSELHNQGMPVRTIVISEGKVIVTWRDNTIPGTQHEIFFAQGK